MSGRYLADGTDLVIAYTGIPDGLQHGFWAFHDPSAPLHQPDASVELRTMIERWHVEIDAVIGRLIEQLDDRTAIVVLSDCWIEVTCPRTHAGRITNYAAFNGSMVPPGKTCLCVEFFHAEATGLLAWSDHALWQLALRECATAGLLSPDRCTDHLILKLPGADAATQWESWRDEGTMQARRAVARLANLYDVNRPGTDRAFHAGLEAARAILSGDRTEFDRRTDPSAPAPWGRGG